MKRPDQKHITKLFLILLLPGGFLLSEITSGFPSLVEKYYSLGADKLLIQFLSYVTGIIPFSLAEILVISLAFYVLWKIIQIILLFGRRKLTFRKIGVCSLNLLVIVSLLYFSFVIIWGLNYNRMTFAQIAGLKISPASTEELAHLCETLIDRTNTLRAEVNEDHKGVMRLSDKEKAFTRAYAGYHRAALVYPQLNGDFGQAKGIIFSEAMSYAGLSGIFFPFTGEANVNMDAPECFLPCTIDHEMAHQRGFAREDEANYIAYYTCRLNPDINFQYSGYLLALVNSMNSLERYDPKKYAQLEKRLDVGVKRDLSDLSTYWTKHEGVLERLSSGVNDFHLRLNHQNAGVYSYGRMVDLLIAESRTEHLQETSKR
ncbi:MAG: DUF3810 domain-containing protein [Chitinophagales bacterium]